MFSLFTAAAAVAATTAPATQQVGPMGVGAALEMLMWLVVVVGFILLCAWAFRRLGSGVLATAGIIRVRSVISVGSRERIALLQVGDKQILVGLCPSQISTLHVFDEDVLATISPTVMEGSTPAHKAADFAAKLQGFIKNPHKDTNK